jgi:dolichyl-phosphate beta-glucosyltransferase
MNPEKLGDLINNGLIVLLIVSFIYVICDRFISDQTLYDLILLPTSDPHRLSYFIEPSPNVIDPLPFPSVFESPELYASFVVPVYNDEHHISQVLDALLNYLTVRQTNDPSFTWEVIAVDDASFDRTADVVLGIARQHPEVRLLRQPRNMGIGAAAQAGCLHARGRITLFIDRAWGTGISEFGAVESKLNDLREADRRVVVIGGGLRLFSREAARWIFPNMHVTGAAYDAEIRAIAAKKKIQIADVTVAVVPPRRDIFERLKMLLDLAQIAAFVPTGIWSVKMKSQIAPADEN